jgi:hypothetical protein
LALRAFQHALSELAASPRLCLALRAGDETFLEQFDLSNVERKRLLEAVWQRGMSVSCSLYRSNRMVPIYTLLNLTCLLLGDDLKKQTTEYWASSQPDLQFKEEVARFSQYLKARAAAGAITNPFLEEVLDFELAIIELQVTPRRRILREIRDAQAGKRLGPLQLNPLIRVVRFRHDPLVLLDMLRQRRAATGELPEGEVFVALSAVGEQLDMKLLDAKLGQILMSIQTDGGCRQYCDDLMEAVQEGFLVPTLPPQESDSLSSES